MWSPQCFGFFYWGNSILTKCLIIAEWKHTLGCFFPPQKLKLSEQRISKISRRFQRSLQKLDTQLLLKFKEDGHPTLVTITARHSKLPVNSAYWGISLLLGLGITYQKGIENHFWASSVKILVNPKALLSSLSFHKVQCLYALGSFHSVNMQVI